MRSSSRASNHQSSPPAAQRLNVARAGLPSASFASACRITLPDTGEGASQTRSPEGSVRPLQCGPASQTARSASPDGAGQGTAIRLTSETFS